MKRIFTVLVLGCSAIYSSAQTCSHRGSHVRQNQVPENLRSDTIDVLSYTLNLDVRDFSGQSISGSASIRFRPLMNSIQTLSLDLLMLEVDSVKRNTTHLNYSYNDTLLTINLGTVFNSGDTTEVTVFYHGSPQQDPSGWGGFYWSGTYAFNLGVGFESIPHNYGRVWHPCFDNFVERAKYEFVVTTNSGRKAYCNGELINESINGTDITRTWKMDTPIPSYLASISVAPYTHVLQNYVSPFTALNTPIWLIALPADTTNMKNSFVNLPTAIEGFEWAYGPHYFNKVGFVLVPFSSGAMEHATNIAYPRVTANGTLAYETLMAHELAHHWWGDLVTCETAYDMWINEGMASYSEYLFLEYMYGQQQYRTGIRNNHKNVIWKAHTEDGGFHALSAVPLEVTYGMTSYDKGADVAHTMRSYLGDSLFFAGLRTIIANNQLQNLNSESFRDQLNALPGIDVTDFFQDWVLSPGFPEFSIDSIQVVPSGTEYDVTVFVRQKLRGALQFFNNVPMSVSFRNTNWEVETRKMILSGEFTQETFTLPFQPVHWALNEDEMISEAVTADNWVITAPGFKSFNHSNFQLNADVVTDSAFFRVEQHWVAADPFFVNDFLNVISPDRFWRISGIEWNENVIAQGRFSYNGTQTSGGYLDNMLMTDYGSMLFHEDSIRLFYRPNPGENWVEYPYYNRSTQASKTDKVGLIVADSLRTGDYAFGMRISSLQVSDYVPELKMRLFPNPAVDQVRVELDGPLVGDYQIFLMDISGREVMQAGLSQRSNSLDVSGLTSGTYLVHLRRNNQLVSVGKLIVR